MCVVLIYVKTNIELMIFFNLNENVYNSLIVAFSFINVIDDDVVDYDLFNNKVIIFVCCCCCCCLFSLSIKQPLLLIIYGWFI